jgi:hypothetical protein
MEKSIVEVILQYGGLGAVLIVVGWAYFKKDQQVTAAGVRLQAEQEKRIADAAAHAELLREEQERRVADGKAWSKALQEEQQLRIEDAKAYLKLAMQLQESVIAAVNKLSDIVEVFEKRETAREVREERTHR